jgi:hypothetical protein
MIWIALRSRLTEPLRASFFLKEEHNQFDWLKNGRSTLNPQHLTISLMTFPDNSLSKKKKGGGNKPNPPSLSV